MLTSARATNASGPHLRSGRASNARAHPARPAWLSEPIRNVSPIGARLADESVIETQGASIKILLIKRVGEVLPIGKVFDPRTDHEALLTGALKCHARIGNAISPLGVALSVEGVEVLFTVKVCISHQVQIARREVYGAPVEIEAGVV